MTLRKVFTVFSVSVIVALAAAKAGAERGFAPVDRKLLGELLVERGFKPPGRFKARLVRITRKDDGALRYQPFELGDTGTHRQNWWPASTVKIYAAVAALERTRRLGFSLRVTARFEYEEKPVTQRLADIVRRAITSSRNPEFDRLVEIAGFKNLNDRFLRPTNGVRDTVLLRAYTRRHTYAENGKGCNRFSPRIILREGKREKILPATEGKGEYDCPDQGNCTTLADLGEVLRRVMLHEELPEKERFALGEKELKLLRSALEGERPKPDGVQEAIREVFAGREFRVFHKPGYATGWYSNNVFLHFTDTGERWIVGLVNYGGRASLDEGARHVLRLIAEGLLQGKTRSSVEKKAAQR